MSEQTKIQWCDSTANPVIGCEQISPGCADCYAKRSTPARQLRARGIETWGPHGVRHETKGFEKAMLAFNARPWVCDDCGSAPESDGDCECGQIGATRRVHRRRVFVNSLSDWLDPRWPVATLARTLDVWRRCQDIEIITCTKRPELFDRRLQAVIESQERYVPLESWLIDWAHAGNAPRNITILTSVENQAMADERIPHLLKIPAARRGLSMEPLLGPVDVTRIPLGNPAEKRTWSLTGTVDDDGWPESRLRPIHWLIIGGESGPKARPCNVEWIRSLVRQGAGAGVPVFVKQLGSNPIRAENDEPFERAVGVGSDGDKARMVPYDKKGADPAEWPEDLRVRQWPKADN